MKSRISAPHIKKLIESGLANPVDEALSREFSKKLESMEWQISKLDWSRFPGHIVFNIDDYSEDQIYSELMKTSLSDADDVFVLYGADEKGLKCSLEVFARNFDVLFWEAPGTRFACGIDSVGKKLFFENGFIEYDGASTIKGFRSIRRS
jgi:hypothetical protein